MPARWACIAILLAWAVASVSLISRDVLPDLLIGPPPDMRTVAAADREAGPTKWAILVADGDSLQNLRSVGQATTESTLDTDGRLKLTSRAWFNSRDLLKGTPLAFFVDPRREPASDLATRVDVENSCEVSRSGNLESFRAVVRAEGLDAPLLILDGLFKDRAIEVRARIPLTQQDYNKSFPYEPKTMIQSALGPIDRIPGLAVGQRWEARIVSPLTGNVEVVKAEVTRRSEIYWDRSMVATYELVQRVPPAISARTWVRRSDGLVLRQEVPFPMVKLIIERLPGRD